MTSLTTLSDVDADLGACMNRFDAMMAFPDFRTAYNAVHPLVWSIMFGDRWNLNFANNVALILAWRVRMFKEQSDRGVADERLEWMKNNFDSAYFIWWDVNGHSFAYCRDASDALMYEMKWG